MALNVVVLEKDPAVAQSLAGGLCPHFSVHLAASDEHLLDNVARSHAHAVVLNLEHWPLCDLERLHHAFPNISIVCTHRVPDEEMWMAALSAGACDVCPADDINNVLTAILRHTGIPGTAAA